MTDQLASVEVEITSWLSGLDLAGLHRTYGWKAEIDGVAYGRTVNGGWTETPDQYHLNQIRRNITATFNRMRDDPTQPTIDLWHLKTMTEQHITALNERMAALSEGDREYALWHTMNHWASRGTLMGPIDHCTHAGTCSPNPAYEHPIRATKQVIRGT